MLRQHDSGRRVRRALPYARSRDDHQPRSRDEAPLQAAMARLAEARPTSGSRRITALRRRDQAQVNHTHVARLMGGVGLPRPRPPRRPRTTERAHPSPRYPNLVQTLEITPPDHVWVGALPAAR
jgi:hypothetical protein